MIDTVRINVKAGNGGDGCISFLRLKYQPRGGPDGGDGGDGGNAYIMGDASINTLLHLKYNSTFYLQRGSHGKGKNQRGANGKDTQIRVPMGTVVWRMHPDGSKDFVADVTSDDPVLVAKGGEGGWGNARFVSSTNQEPMLAQSGSKGEYSVLWLEMKLLADVGLLAKPNAGKSTLISRCSAARPKVADYPFTTVEPVLGVVTHGGQDFVMMEVPGLLEGAHRGIGLGHQFLRHAERARVYVHLIDGMSDDPAGDYLMLNRELREFSPMLAAKPQVVAVSKLDTTETYELRDVIEEELRRAMAGEDGFDPSDDERQSTSFRRSPAPAWTACLANWRVSSRTLPGPAWTNRSGMMMTGQARLPRLHRGVRWDFTWTATCTWWNRSGWNDSRAGPICGTTGCCCNCGGR